MADSSRRFGCAALLLCLPAAAALRVDFSIASSAEKLITLQDFGTTGGSINVSLSIVPQDCLIGSAVASSSNVTPSCWAGLDQTYLAIFNQAQWLNLSHWLASHEGMYTASDGTQICTQPADGWTSLSLLSWQDAALTAQGAADLTLNEGRFVPAAAADASIRPPPVPPAPIDFQIGFTLPNRQDVYSLSVFNCQRTTLVFSGEASFRGGNGETLSKRQHDVLSVRYGLITAMFASALLLIIYCWMHRATAVPLHGLLVVVFVLRGVQQIMLMLPLLAAAHDVLTPAGGLVTASALDTYNGGEMREEPSSGGGGSASSASVPAQPIGGMAPPAPPPFTANGPLYKSPAASINATDWGLQTTSLLVASASEQLSSLCLMTALLAVAAGRHFLSPLQPVREREMLTISYVLYLGFGMLQEACTGQVLCGVFVLSYQVVRILLVFAVLLFLNATSDVLRRATGHNWPQLREDVLRLITFREIRIRLLMVFLILPIVCLFLEVVLDWKATWFRVLWREGLEYYIVVAVAWRLPPTPLTYMIHFASLRPLTAAEVAPGLYPRFFRFLLGSGINTARADAAVAQYTEAVQAAHARRGHRARAD